MRDEAREAADAADGTKVGRFLVRSICSFNTIFALHVNALLNNHQQGIFMLNRE